MEGLLGWGAAIVILGVLLVGGAIAAFILKSWIKVARPDEALVISGKKGKTDGSNLNVVVHGKAVINPITQQYETISLRSRQVTMRVEAQSQDNIKLNVEAVALVKISSDIDDLKKAAERFASQDAEVDKFTTEQLEGSLRGTIANLTVQKLMRERQDVSMDIKQVIEPELRKQGLLLDSFQIKEITDDGDYIKSLGIPEMQEKWREAEIARANTERQVNQRQIAVNEENLKEQTVYEKNEQAAAAEVGEARARAEQAERLAQAEAEEEVLKQQVANQKSRLEAEVHAKADAEYYRRQREIDSEAYEQEKRSQAELAVSENKAKADRLKADAEAHARRVKAEAEAHAERELGKARAEAIAKEAEALAQHQEAFLANRAIEILPELMGRFTQGYNSIGDLTIIGGDETSGGGHLALEHAKSLKSVFNTVKDTVGIDMQDIINSNIQGTAFGNALRETGATTSTTGVDRGADDATGNDTPPAPESGETSSQDTRYNLPDIPGYSEGND